MPTPHTQEVERLVEEFKTLGIWWRTTEDDAELEPIEDTLVKLSIEDEQGEKVDLLDWLRTALTTIATQAQEEARAKFAEGLSYFLDGLLDGVSEQERKVLLEQVLAIGLQASDKPQ